MYLFGVIIGFVDLCVLITWVLLLALLCWLCFDGWLLICLCCFWFLCCFKLLVFYLVDLRL